MFDNVIISLQTQKPCNSCIKGQVAPFYVTVIKHYLVSSNVNLSVFINLPVSSIILYCKNKV